MIATVIKMSIQRMVCTGCGAEANASCNCGLNYTPASIRAAEAIAANPEKSDRAIAADIGVHHTTVGRIRNAGGASAPPEQSADDLSPVADATPEKRIGRDGKSYSATKRKRHRGKRMPDFVDEPQHDRDLHTLQTIWDGTCETAREEFLKCPTAGIQPVDHVGLDGKARQLPERTIDDEADEDIEAYIEPQNYRGAFLIRADQAKQFAVYSGPVTKETATMARQVAAVWSSLADQMEKSPASVVDTINGGGR